MEDTLQNTVTGRTGRGPGLAPGYQWFMVGNVATQPKGVFSWAPVGTQPRTQGLRCHLSSWPCHPHLAGPLTSARHWTPQSSVTFTLYLRAWGEPLSAFISPHKTHGALGVHPSPPPSQELSWNPSLQLSVHPQPPAPPTHNQHLTSTSVAVLTASQPCVLRSKRGLRPPHWCIGMKRIQEKRECQLHNSPAGSKDGAGIHLRPLPPELPSCWRVLWSLPPGVTRVTMA